MLARLNCHGHNCPLWNKNWLWILGQTNAVCLSTVSVHYAGAWAVISVSWDLKIQMDLLKSSHGCLNLNPHLKKSCSEGSPACGQTSPCCFFTAAFAKCLPTISEENQQKQSAALPSPALPPSSPHHFFYSSPEFTRKDIRYSDTLKTSRGLGNEQCIGLAVQLAAFYGLLRKTAISFMLM